VEASLRRAYFYIYRQIVENPLPKVRLRTEFHRHPMYYMVRNRIIDFLVSRSRTFLAEKGRQFDPRHLSVVRLRDREAEAAASTAQWSPPPKRA
jgi:nitrate/nitrite transport system ATP-binding protein